MCYDAFTHTTTENLRALCPGSVNCTYLRGDDFASSALADAVSFCGHMAAVDCGPELSRYLGFHWYALKCGSDVRVGCRHCLQLAYDSQQDSGWHRSLHRAISARLKLGGSAILAEPLPGKPKGMHWRTYDRLYARAAEREAAVFGGLARSFLINCERGENNG